MQRPNIVLIGGTADQPIECVYAGADGARALDTFHEHADDGHNELVRLFTFPEPVKIATPKRYEVAPKERDPEAQAPTAQQWADARAAFADLTRQNEAERAKVAAAQADTRAAQVEIEKLKTALEKAVAKAAKPKAGIPPVG